MCTFYKYILIFQRFSLETSFKLQIVYTQCVCIAHLVAVAVSCLFVYSFYVLHLQNLFSSIFRMNEKEKKTEFDSNLCTEIQWKIVKLFHGILQTKACSMDGEIMQQYTIHIAELANTKVVKFSFRSSSCIRTRIRIQWYAVEQSVWYTFMCVIVKCMLSFSGASLSK